MLEKGELALLVDTYGAARQTRLEADKEAGRLKKDEEKLKAALMAEMGEQGMGTVGGKAYGVTIQEGQKPIVSDWDALYAYILEHKAFDLLHKRLGQEAAKLRMEDMELPGVTTEPTIDLSVRKL